MSIVTNCKHNFMNHMSVRKGRGIVRVCGLFFFLEGGGTNIRNEEYDQ